MPDYPSTSKFLYEEEHILACQRLAMDGIGVTQGAHLKVGKRTAFMMTIKDWRVWSQTVLFNLVTGSQTMQYFLPTIVGVFGWKGYEGQCTYYSLPRI